ARSDHLGKGAPTPAARTKSERAGRRPSRAGPANFVHDAGDTVAVDAKFGRPVGYRVERIG
ncbi:MAG: hypothetical protein AAFV72_24205, partial [Cyanobacteria bacterium J06635_1]